MPAGDEKGPPERPDYKVYRSRRGSLGGISAGGLSGLRDRLRRKPSDGDDERAPEPIGEPRRRPPWRRIAKWAALAALGWILLSLLAFAVSSQIQKSKLAEGVGDELDGNNPFLLASPQTILVLGTDVRSGAFAGPTEAESEACLDAVGSGEATDEKCDLGPYRSDTILLVRAGAGKFTKLSIPRDTVAEIPGVGVDKINAGYANGGAALEIQTVENFLGLDIDQVAILDFDGFRNFIDTLGGIEVDLATDVCSSVSEGAFNLNLKAGKNELDGFKAITLARTRGNTCGDQMFSGTDLERATFQQAILDGIRGRLTDPLRLPYNFIKGPLIGWNAPRAMVSSMGGLTMPQLALAAAIGGSESIVMEPASLEPLIYDQSECDRAVEEFLGKEPPRTPACSPTG